MHLLIVVLLLAWVSAQGTPTHPSMPTVTLDYCTVVPVAGNESLGYYKYQNIRYAAVPTGDLRWAKPQWPPVETEVNNGSLADADVDCASQEDCLYLDVWAPANRTSEKKLPVMVWIYGGGFTGGSKAQNTPEGLFSLSTDFIFVAFNYRLGITGLANGPTVLHEGATSNTALWDVQHAFQWTRKYIGAFGGDPEQITAVGFSAGASQVLFQMTVLALPNYLSGLLLILLLQRFAGHAEQLFARAYVMSPGFVPGGGHHHAEVSSLAILQAASLTVWLSADVLAERLIGRGLRGRTYRLHAQGQLFHADQRCQRGARKPNLSVPAARRRRLCC